MGKKLPFGVARSVQPKGGKGFADFPAVLQLYLQVYLVDRTHGVEEASTGSS
jgi:hypothetical protein